MKIDETKIWDLLEQPLDKLVVFDKIDSTMNYAQTKTWSGNNLVIAESQTAGKGQHGHSFASPATGIYATIIVPAKLQFLAQPGMLTLGVGVCVHKAIKLVLGVNTQLKWVNDLYYKQKKCGGILVETKSDATNHIQNFVIGIGLNLMNNDQLQKVNGINLVKNDFQKNELIVKIYDLVIKMLKHPNPQLIINDYQNCLLWKDQLVSILANDVKIRGRIIGISSDFRLTLIDEHHHKYLLTASASQHLRIR